MMFASAMLIVQTSRFAAQAPVRRRADGEMLAFDRGKGNCLSCHEIKGGDPPGNIGPALEDMKAPFRTAINCRDLHRRDQAKSTTVMPPFGRNLILTDKEIIGDRRLSPRSINRDREQLRRRHMCIHWSRAPATADPQGRRLGRACPTGHGGDRRRGQRAPPTPVGRRRLAKVRRDAIKSLFGKSAEASDKVKLDAPEIAENGAVVPIAITPRCRRDVDLPDGGGDPYALGLLQDSRRNHGGGRKPAEDGQDQQGGRNRGIGRKALQRHKRSQSHSRRLRRLR